MKLLIGMVATLMAVARSAFAQDAGTDASTMTCAEFIALDTAGQTGAMASIQAAAVAAAAAIEEGTGVDSAADSDAEVGTGTAVPGIDTAAAADVGSTDAGTAAGADRAVAGDVAAGEAGPPPGDMTTALLAACSSVPDMRVTDAMLQAQADGAGGAGSTGGNEGDAGAVDSEAGGG